MGKNNDNITSERIKELMGDETQTSFAKRIGASQPLVSKLIGGELPSTTILLAIAKEYDVSVDWLLGLSEQKSIHDVPPAENMTYADALCVLDKLLRMGGIQPHRIDQPRSLNIRDEVLYCLLRSRAKAEGLDKKTREFWYQQIAEQFLSAEVIEWQDSCTSHFEQYVPKNPDNEQLLGFLEKEIDGTYDDWDSFDFKF